MSYIMHYHEILTFAAFDACLNRACVLALSLDLCAGVPVHVVLQL